MGENLRLRSEAIAWREVDGEVIALGLESSTYFGTNASGAILWKRLADGAPREQLIEDLVTAFGLEPSRAEADVDAFVAELQRRGLLAE